MKQNKNSKIKKVISSIVMLFIGLFVLIGCGGEDTKGETGTEVDTGSAEESIKVGFLTGTAGLGDGSFNDIAHEGALLAEEELDIDLTVVEPGDLSAASGLLRNLVQAENELIIAVGFDMVDPVNEVATEYPDTKFAIVDAVVDLPNVQSLVFNEHEGSFLVGALAGLMTETNKVAVVPANDVPFLNRFAVAYEEGVEHTNPDSEVITQYIGSDMDAFNNPGEMKSIALSLYSQGTDIIYPVAGGSGTGLFEAVKETDKYAFGINSDQDDEAPGNILTSMIKGLDVAVFTSIESVLNEEFENGIQEYGLANGGIRLSDMRHTEDLIGEDILNELKQIEEAIISGEIQVTDLTAE